MNSIVVFCSIFTVMVFGQDIQRERPNIFRAGNPHHPGPQVVESNLSAAIPETQDWRDVMSSANNGMGINQARDFLSLLVHEDGTPVTENEVFTAVSPDGKQVVAEGGVMASPDECSPRNVTVRLPLDFSDSRVAYWPECTMVQRCGGCTPPNLSCEPLYVENIVLKVMKAEFTHPGSLNLQWKGYESVSVERHMSCRPTCTLTATSCAANQSFKPYQCKCQCNTFKQCTTAQKWDADSCSCRCLNVVPCCQGGDQASCRYQFDHNSCSCTLKQSVSGAAELTQAEIEAFRAAQADTNGELTIDEWLEQNHQPPTEHAGEDINAAGSETTPASTTTTTTTTTPEPTTTTTPEPTTTTTAETTTQDFCATKVCPHLFEAQRRGDRCVCVFSSARGRLPIGRLARRN